MVLTLEHHVVVANLALIISESTVLGHSSYGQLSEDEVQGN